MDRGIQKMRKILKIALVLTVAAILMGLLINQAYAGVITDVGSFIKNEALPLIFQWITNILTQVARVVFIIGGALIELGIQLNAEILNSSTVRTGFAITLNLANLGFVLAIIVLAIATILRAGGYEIKKMLPRLILAALLVNFSLGIAGLFIDFTGVLSHFFISQATDGINKDFGVNLAAAFNPQALESMKPSAGADPGTVILSGLFTLWFTILLAIAMVGTAVMIFIRYIYLTVLLILMPLAWMLFVFPDFEDKWKAWWNQFIKWCFFMPAAVFFLYLAIFVATQAGDYYLTQSKNSAQSFEQLAAVNQQGFFANIGKMAAILGLVIGGLIAAEKMGIAGAGMFMNAASAVNKWGLGVAGKVGKGAARMAGERPLKALSRGTASLLNTKGLRWFPGAKTAIAGLSSFGARKEDVEEYQKKYLSQLSDGNFDKMMAKGTRLTGPVEKAAILAEAIKRKKLSRLKELQGTNIKAFGDAARATNPEIAEAEKIPMIKDILESDPRLAPELLNITDPAAAAAKIREISQKIKADKAPEIDKKALTDLSVVLGLNKSAIAAIMRSGSDEQTANLKTALENLSGDYGTAMKALEVQMENITKAIQYAQDRNDRAEVSRLRGEYDNMLAEIKDQEARADRPDASPELKNQKLAYDKRKFMEQNIGNMFRF
jgi:hypothetical protein